MLYQLTPEKSPSPKAWEGKAPEDTWWGKEIPPLWLKKGLAQLQLVKDPGGKAIRSQDTDRIDGSCYQEVIQPERDPNRKGRQQRGSQSGHQEGNDCSSLVILIIETDS